MQAKEIVENKFWVLESYSGKKVGTIGVKNNTVVATIENHTQVFNSFDELLAKYDVNFVSEYETSNKVDQEVYGYPTKHMPYNALWNAAYKIPMYTPSNASSSYHCAGYYAVKIDDAWSIEFCPKLIIIKRNECKGPFKTEIEAAKYV